MPDPVLSQAIKEAYAVAPANDIIFYTVELRHTAFTAPIRLVLNNEDIQATLEATAPENPSELVDFIHMQFRLGKPELDDTSSPQLTLEIDNVSTEIEENIALAIESTSPVEVTYREFLFSDLSGPQNDPPLHMEVSTIKATDSVVSAVCSFGSFANRRFPNQLYTVERFPQLAR